VGVHGKTFDDGACSRVFVPLWRVEPGHRKRVRVRKRSFVSCRKIRARDQDVIRANSAVIGNSPALESVLEKVEQSRPRIPRSDPGRNSTGKELIARAIHNLSVLRTPIYY